MLLAHPAFAFLWCSRVLANVAFNMLGVAVGWQLYALTGRALDLGLVGLAQFAPIVVLTLIVGQVADRYDRRLITAICLFVEAATAAALVVGTVAGWLSNTSIFAIMALVGAARAFESPTTTALVSDVVPRPLVARAMAWVVSATQTARIVGPALGGFLYVIGPGTTYLTAGALFVCAGMCAAVIRSRRAARASEPVMLESVLSGIVFIRDQRVLLGTMSLDLFAVLLGGGATALLPIYARDILGTGPGGLGLLRAAPAVGALATSVFLAYRPLRWRIGRTLFRAVMVFGVATVVFGVSSSFAVSLAALGVLGAADVVSVVIRASLVQIRTPDTMRGRVSAVHSLFTGTSNQLGAFASGLAAALFGAIPAVLLGGLGTIAVAALWIRLFPELRRIRSFEE
ncbi:MAG TPA: MFS transporter [Candidatus Binatia bacterium]|nr:MFS transporter [Candidatus Binatia bacterium]